jgi:HPt (histidine-containing phosphotransfer) domain-containing protein
LTGLDSRPILPARTGLGPVLNRRPAVLRQAVPTGDAPAVQRTAHGLKGAAGYVGGKPAAAAAERFEQIGASGDLADAPRALDALAREVNRLTAALADVPQPSTA